MGSESKENRLWLKLGSVADDNGTQQQYQHFQNLKLYITLEANNNYYTYF